MHTHFSMCVGALVLKPAKKRPQKISTNFVINLAPGGLEIFRCLFYINLREIDNRNLCIIMVKYKFLIDCLPLWEDFTRPVCRYVQTPEVVMD